MQMLVGPKVSVAARRKTQMTYNTLTHLTNTAGAGIKKTRHLCILLYET